MRWHKTGSSISLDTSPGLQDAVAFMWEKKFEMTLKQRRGLAYVAYISMCASFEDLVSDAIKARLISATHIIKKDGLSPTFIRRGDETSEPEDSSVFTSAIIKLAELAAEQPGQYEGLKKTYKIVFATSLKDLIGDLEGDVAAVYDLRNIIAHGRSFKVDMEYEIIDNEKFGASTDSREGQLQRVFSRLSMANLLPEKPYHGLIDYLTEDKVIKHFRDQLFKAMEIIKSNSSNSFEKLHMNHKFPFPNLDL